MAKRKSQVDRFREAAKEVGADDSQDTFNATLKHLAKSNPRKADKPEATESGKGAKPKQ